MMGKGNMPTRSQATRLTVAIIVQKAFPLKLSFALARQVPKGK
jgi:hypothetical protein